MNFILYITIKKLLRKSYGSTVLNINLNNNNVEKQSINRIVKVIFNISILEIIYYKQILDDCSQNYHGKLTEEEINFLLGNFRTVRGRNSRKK